jgi:hypothetical protein
MKREMSRHLSFRCVVFISRPNTVTQKEREIEIQSFSLVVILHKQTVPSFSFGIFSKLYEIGGGRRGHTWIRYHKNKNEF